MKMFWVRELYGTEIPRIDAQHKDLFERINKLSQSIEHGATKAEILNLFNFLENYTKDHFNCEELIMEQRRCTSCADNKEAHEKFKVEFSKFKNEFLEKGLSEPFIRKLDDFLGSWWRSHIMTIDIKLRDTVRKS